MKDPVHNPEKLRNIGRGYRLLRKSEFERMLRSKKTMPGLEMSVCRGMHNVWIPAVGDSWQVTYRVPK